MKEKIKHYLTVLEQENQIKILLACETGSRAWGFASPDSDYDVRLIYRHQKDWYISLTEGKDTIERMLDNNEVDISGWDLRKSLRLLWKSNPPLLERIQSPLLYSADNAFLEGITTIARSAYSRIATMHHYLSMAKKGYETICETQEYKLKKLFYTLRASVACTWILEREEMPPIVFQQMLEGLQLDEHIKERIHQLVALKATCSEAYSHTGEQELIDFMRRCINRADAGAKKLPVSTARMSDLDHFFRQMLEE